MAKLTIPERYQAGVSEIRKLDEETAARIRSALDRIFASQEKEDETKVIGPDAITLNAVADLPSKSSINFKALAESLAAMYTVKSQKEISLNEFTDEVSDALESLEKEDLKLRRGERERFKANLFTLLNADVFALGAKAYDLKTDDERTFCSARILTDLRPIFGQHVEDGPRAMVVVHLLKLGYHEGSEKHQQFYVSLDSDDLRELKRVIKRAEAKADTLRGSVKNMRVFGIPSKES